MSNESDLLNSVVKTEVSDSIGRSMQAAAIIGAVAATGLEYVSRNSTTASVITTAMVGGLGALGICANPALPMIGNAIMHGNDMSETGVAVSVGATIMVGSYMSGRLVASFGKHTEA